MKAMVLITACLTFSLPAYAAERIFRTEGAVVSYDGISAEYAEAIAKTAAAARDIALLGSGFDMPKTIRITVACNPRGRVRLFNDGRDYFGLTIRTEKDLRKPAQSGIFHIYGLCHETAHLAMYRPIRERRWMTTAAAEGWAHYFGSRIVDTVYAKLGKDLWPDAYDYLADGTKRLQRQLAAKNPSPVQRGAGLWKELAEIVGHKNLAPIFKAWGQAKVDPTDPGAALRKTLLATYARIRNLPGSKEQIGADKRLADWWNRAEPILVLKRPRSEFTARTAKPNELTGAAVELSEDEGKSAGRRSIAGSGHAVRRKVDGRDWYLTGVKVFGSRYGQPRPPQEDFHLWLCDKDFKVITDFPFPYAKFPWGKARWVSLPVKPTNVPAEFVICVGFNPTGRKGVFVHHDKQASGNSLTGLPGRPGREFQQGDWLIRASVDQLKIANPLMPSK
ncbi:MAG: hypothetical protein KAT11_04300 [Phycisphaerae bacterium]|nr:hypothetical protein [Phycisphaerae bacterium]